MKKIYFLFAALPLLCACEATGKLVGTVARAPVDIIRAGTGMYTQDQPSQIYTESDLNTQTTLHRP